MAIVRLEMYQPASPWGGWLVLTRSNKREMRKSTTVRMNDYDTVVMGVFEPILVLSVMAVIAFLVRLFW